MKKKLCILALVLMMLVTVASAAYTPLKIVSDGDIYSIYAIYSIPGNYTAIDVDFSDEVESFAYANLVNGKLYISVASATKLDLSNPIAKITATDASGNTVAPKISAEKVTLNGEVYESGDVLLLLGDINADGEVDIKDAITLFQHSMLPDTYPISYGDHPDFTSDGKLDINDAVALFQYSMLPDLYPIN